MEKGRTCAMEHVWRSEDSLMCCFYQHSGDSNSAWQAQQQQQPRYLSHLPDLEWPCFDLFLFSYDFVNLIFLIYTSVYWKRNLRFLIL